jgi:WD40 repeat protein
VSGSDDRTIQVWHIETGDASHLNGHSDWAWSVTISLDGKCIVSGLDDKMIRVWDMGTGKALRDPLQGHTRYVLSVAISPV